MAPRSGVSMDEDFVFKVSLILLCFLSLLLVLVMFLIFWLGKIHHRVESICKGWNAYCILAAREETVPVAENQPAAENTCSIPLVFFNQQAVDSETNSDWKHMDRAFAYGPIHSDEDEPSCPNLEETASVSQGEDKTSVDVEDRTSVDGEDRISVDGPNTPEQTIPDVPVASSFLQIVDDNSTIVAISSSKHPAKDKKDQVKGRIYITLSSPEDVDLDDALEDSADPKHGNGNICGRNETNAQQVNSKKNHISEGAKKSSVDNPECVVLIDKNREPEAAEFYTEVPILMNSQGDEQQNGRTSQELVKNKANGERIEKLPNENDHGCTVVFHPKESSALSTGTEKVLPLHGDESERVFPIQRPKVKRRRKKKRSAGIHSDGKNKADERMSPQDNVSTQPVENLDKTGRDNSDFQQSKSSGISKNEDKDDDEYQIVNYAEQFANKADTNVPVTPEYHAAGISERDREIKPAEGDQDKHIYDYAAPQGVTDWRSSDIVSQLREYLQERLRESQHFDIVKKTTTGPEVTESYSEDTYLTAVQENEARYASQEYHPSTTEQEPQNTTTEPIYANINDINDNYCQTHAGDAHPQVTYVNQGNIQNVRDEHSDSFPIYANIREVQQRSAMCNGNLALRNEYRFPIYDNNDVIDV